MKLKQMNLKLFAMFVLAMFIVSAIPFASAELGDAAQEKIKEKVNERAEKRNSPEAQQKREQAKNFLKLDPKERAEKIKNADLETFREFQKKQLMVAVDKCKENSDDAAKCQAMLEKRVALVDKLAEKDVERLQKIDERKAEQQKKFDALKERPEFAKFMRNNAAEKDAEKYKAREFAKEKMQEMKVRYEEAKQNYQNLKENAQERKQKIDEKKAEVAKACAAPESEECIKLKADLKEQAKESLLRQAEMILESIEKVRAKVDASEDLTDAEAAEIIKQLDEAKAEIETAKATIETSDNKEEIIAAAKKINDVWEKRVKTQLKIAAGKLVNARIGGIVVQSKQLSVKLERILAKMQEKGADTTAVQGLVDEFNGNIDAAKADYEAAIPLLKGNQSEAGHAKLASAKTNLEEARANLAAIVKAVKDANMTEALQDTSSENAEQAAETFNLTDSEVEDADDAQADVENESDSGTDVEDETDEGTSTEAGETA